MITVICLVLVSVTFYCYHWKRKWLYVKNIQFRLSCAKLCQHLEGLELEVVHNFIYMPSISFLNENLMVESGETSVVELTVANDPRRMRTTSLVGERCGELGYSQAELLQYRGAADEFFTPCCIAIWEMALWTLDFMLLFVIPFPCKMHLPFIGPSGEWEPKVNLHSFSSCTPLLIRRCLKVNLAQIFEYNTSFAASLTQIGMNTYWNLLKKNWLKLTQPLYCWTGRRSHTWLSGGSADSG